MSAFVRVCFAALLLSLAVSVPAAAQTTPRFGLGLQLMGSTVEENVGPGIRFRASAPVNRDLSFAFGTSFTGYIFEGQDEASYAMDPQVSVIVTLPVRGVRSTYFLGGAGAYVPLGDTPATSAPSFHFGFGRVWLLQDSSLFLEFVPALVINETRTDALLPIRLGVIF